MKVLILGSNGRMGQQMQKVVAKHGCDFVGVDKENRDVANSFDGDVILDFSNASCLKENLVIAENKKIPIVIGTTGHDSKNIELIEKYKSKIPIFIASNFSIMFNVMLKMLGQLGLLKDCDFIVEETHHKHKIDSPSGSCKEIIKVLENMEIVPNITSYRVGEVVGKHSIKLYSENESLEIKHEVTSRDAFCEGAFKACEFMLKKKQGLYFMEDMLNNL